MRNICEILKKKDVGSIGIGAMIVFIAMVLVAGIAASVLVQTANRLEMQAMTTGEQTTAEVSTGISVFDIEGHKSGTTINYMTITIRPRAGSEAIDLEQTVIELCNGSVKALLSYVDSKTWNFASAVSAYDGRVFNTNTIGWNMTNEEFGIIRLEDADNSVLVGTPVINRGDTVMLCVNCANCFDGSPAGLSSREDIWGQVIPEEGGFGAFSFRVPSSISDTVYDLY